MSLLEEVIGSFRSQKRLADRAIDQLDEGEFNTTLGDEGNSIATICQHVAWNQRSRWTDFLTTDGEKPDRHRDEEFEPSGAPRGEILDRWEEGWAILFQTLESLTEEDLSKTVTIRGEEDNPISPDASVRAKGIALTKQTLDCCAAAGVETLLDDRNERAGVKFKDSELVGIPFRVVTGRSLKNGKVEVVQRATKEAQEMAIADVVPTLKQWVADAL